METTPTFLKCHRAIYECHRAFERAVDEKQLLPRVCDIWIEYGGFLAASVAYTEPGAHNLITPLAQAGNQGALGNNLDRTSHEAESEDAASVATSTGQMYCMNGHLSLPLKCDGKVFGAITLCASDPSQFDQGVVELLNVWSDFFARQLLELRKQEQRQEAEAALRERESGLRQLIDAIPQHILILGPDGVPMFVNQAWVDYHGRTLEEVQSPDSALESIHPDDRPRVLIECTRGYSGKVPFETEFRLRRRDGQYRWFLFRLNPLQNQHGSIVRWYSSATDIDNLKSAEDHLRLVVDTTPAMIHSARPDGYVDFLNQGWLDYVGIPSEDLCGWRWTNSFHPDDVEGWVAKWRAALASGLPFEGEGRVRRADGEYRALLHRKVPLRDKQGNVVKWYGTSFDIEDRKRAEEELRRSEFYLSEGQRLAHSGSWAFNPSGYFDHWSRELFQIYGINTAGKIPTLEEYLGFVHPQDRESMARTIERMVAEKSGCDIKKRIVRPDGELRYIRCVGIPVVDDGVLRSIVGTAIDITEQEQLTQELRRREAYLAEAQRLSHTGSFGWSVLSGEIVWSDETFQIFEYDRAVKPTLELLLQRVHPDDRALVQQVIDRASRGGTNFEHAHRLLLPDGAVKYLHVLAHALQDSSGNLEFVGAVTDITAMKQAEKALRKSEEQWRDVFENNPTMYFMVDAAGTVMAVNPFGAEQLGYKVDELVGQAVLNVFYVSDRDAVRRNFALCLEQIGESMSWELRKVRKDGSVLWVRETARAVLRANDPVALIACEDITERKNAEEKIREQEVELRQVLDLAPQHISVEEPDGNRLYANQASLNYYGLTLDEWRSSEGRRVFYPGDWERITREVQNKFLSGSPHEAEARLLGRDGKYRWFLLRRNPLRDDRGRITRWYLAGTDIEDRKQAEERLQHENVALREEIDKTSMFEEIVGTSTALQTVVSRISKVAPTDSTVLITGETGTGKELVARAIHRRSRRSSHSFVSVNCAAIPRDLIASELFGHEKGAFTGATQRRLGRFELAEGGTIFLDELGELPAETQIALLRVLQEREFERVGGTRSIHADVRVIAATNRDLQAAIAAGTFRSDLFYRLNVFPLEIPPLRVRREDIPLLVEYFIDRYARKTGKSIRRVDKKSLDMLQSYPWPGNIRELQNVIERSVIVCETECFSVDESWLSSRQPLAAEVSSSLDLSEKIALQEQEMIEAALSEAGGRVSGALGAAAKLGMPRSTLESKIRSLKINKNRFKSSA